ncbi:hypothetical protein FQN57_005992, partial [Myotisia sp. PD_48]
NGVAPLHAMQDDRKRKVPGIDLIDLTTDDNYNADDSGVPVSFVSSKIITTTVPTKAHDGPASKKKRRTSPSSSTSSSRCSSKSRSKKDKPATSIPWPEAFKSLSKVHGALNLVYTFCCTRKHFTTTFEAIKGSVESRMGGRKLTVEDVAKVKALLPHSVRFEITDLGVSDVMNIRDARKINRGQIWDDWEAEGLQNRGIIEQGFQVVKPDTDLLFEFVDGDPRIDTDRTSNFARTHPESDLGMPLYNQKHMLTLIEKRNKKFSDAVVEFLVQCQATNTDPIDRLEAEKEAYMPFTPESERDTLAGVKLPAQIPKERLSISEIITEIKQHSWYTNQITPNGHRVIEAQEPIYGHLNFLLSQNLVNALYNTRGITEFYSHQAEAINNLHNGHNVIVSTSTSSGKSLIYQVPMLHELEKDINSRGMYIFPTKALAQDQRQSMLDMLQYMDGLEHIVVETFDGDTPMQNRNAIRDEARIIFTNPDMLHITILPKESSWRTFLRNLKIVVVDELHVYNGLFGSHVALVMRRLRRICASVGNPSVKFVSCSATIANPEKHMKTIFGIDEVRVTEIDGSPSGKKEFVCWNTPQKDPSDKKSERGNAVQESAKLFCQLVLRGVRVIAFCRVREQCETLLGAIKDEFSKLDRTNVARFVMGYRGGYSPQDRRKIEREMFEGKLLGIVATNALELGVDIGSLDAVITHEFPYSISNLRQQSGRAGRRNKDSLSVLVGGASAVDQYYMNNPDELFTKPNCELHVDLENELVLEGHIQCAAFEMPISPNEDSVYFGPQLLDLAATRLVKDEMGFYHCHERFRPHPSRCVAIRDINQDHYAVIDTTNNRNVVIEELEDDRVLFTAYEGAVYLNQGNKYLVKELNTSKRYARVVRVNVDWTTQQRDFTDIDPIETEAVRRISRSSDFRAFFGAIKIHTHVYGYFKLDKRGKILDALALDCPPVDRFSKGMWLDVPRIALDILASHNLNAAAAIHAAEHAVMSLMPTFIISSPGDIRTECKVAKKELIGPKHQQEPSDHPEIPDSSTSNHFFHPRIPPAPRRQRPARLTFYDAKGGSAGSGITAKAFEFADSVLLRAHNRIEACSCVDSKGCVECVCDAKCKEKSIVMSKAGALVILKCLLGLEVDVDSLPWGGDPGGTSIELSSGLETIVEANEVIMKTGIVLKEFDELGS